MSVEVRIPHGLGVEAAHERLVEVARKHEVRLAAEDGSSGTLEKRVGFLGSVRGRYRVEAEVIEIAVTESPPFVPAETLRRLLQDELGRELAGGKG